MEKKVTVLDIQKIKDDGRKITMLTAYDYPFARILDSAGVDILLVGDSSGSVVAGYENTLPVTMDEVIYHTRAVARGRKKALMVSDMPFMSYQLSIPDARFNAGRFLKEGGAEAVKIEGGVQIKDTIKAIVEIDIPVMGHIGLTPQSIHRMGGYKIQGRKEGQAEALLADALAVEEAGAFAVVLEGVTAALAEKITRELRIPTIGIGAGPHCSGQVLVIHDLLGLSGRKLKFARQYADMEKVMSEAVKKYLDDVKSGSFPSEEESF
ncbi:MAG: 3-methyl-2-oxobutanoate hydroxymethyltransferase [Deltaproteobacteria bacterium]|nr:3-methyl-2-oxobutanoate hydroxymethyltransferase [Deltaproteobacteria bacterium]